MKYAAEELRDYVRGMTDVELPNVLERIRRDPDATFYGVSQNDWRGYCECTNCAAVDAEEASHAGTMVRFVNAIAEAVEKEFPGKFIETLAYQYTRKPPKITKLRHNVIPCLCTIECEFNRPFGVSTNAANVSFESAGREVPSLLPDEESVLSFIEKVLNFYRSNGLPGERFCKTLDRLGFEQVLL